MGLRLDPPSLLLPRANQKWMLQEINKNFKKGERRLLYSCIQCRSVTLPLRSFFVDFYFFYFFGNNLSSQENVTLPCQLCLRLTPPPATTTTLSLPLFASLLLPLPLTSRLQHAHAPLLLSHSFCFFHSQISSAPLLRQDSVAHRGYIRILEWKIYKVSHMVTCALQKENRRRGVEREAHSSLPSLSGFLIPY